MTTFLVKSFFAPPENIPKTPAKKPAEKENSSPEFSKEPFLWKIAELIQIILLQFFRGGEAGFVLVQVVAGTEKPEEIAEILADVQPV